MFNLWKPQWYKDIQTCLIKYGELCQGYDALTIKYGKIDKRLTEFNLTFKAHRRELNELQTAIKSLIDSFNSSEKINNDTFKLVKLLEVKLNEIKNTELNSIVEQIRKGSA